MESVQKHLENEHSEKTATGSHQLFSFTVAWDEMGQDWDGEWVTLGSWVEDAAGLQLAAWKKTRGVLTPTPSTP